jgi:hypothetical protein
VTTFYLDPVSGNDANNGTSFANRWKTLTTGATAARIAPGDTIRVIKSPDPTLIGNANWTNNSNTITLGAAVSTNIATCDSAWTGSTNVTATVGSSIVNCLKEGTGYANLSIASGFTTGKVAYFATGTLDLSGYQQVSLWFRSSTALASGVFEIRLCTDTIGNVSAHTFQLPAAAADLNHPYTVDLGANMNAAIASIAVYALVDPGTRVLQLDNIIACKASSSADSLTLNSLIGKKWNQNWAASTSYAQNDIVRPSIGNRNGFVYKKTDAGSDTSGGSEPTWPREIGATVTDNTITWECYDVEETWYPIKSINGTTVILDYWSSVPAGGYTNGYYQGATETVSTYKREPLFCMPTTVNGAVLGNPTEDGSYGNVFTVSGGWDRTAMSTRDGETWIDGAGAGLFCSMNKAYWVFDNINVARCAYAYVLNGTTLGSIALKNCHIVGCANSIILGDFSVSSENGYGDLDGVVCMFNQVGPVLSFPTKGRCIRADANGNGAGIYLDNAGDTFGEPKVLNWVRCGGQRYGIYANYASDVYVRNLITARNNSGIYTRNGQMRLFNWTSQTDTLLVETPSASDNMAGVWVSKLSGDANSHALVTNNSPVNAIETVTDQRHTASGVAWRFTNAGLEPWPLRLVICKVKCLANTAYTFKVWTRRNDTGMHGRCSLEGGQIPGVPDDVTVLCDPTVDTWVQSSALSWTPTANGVVEIVFETWAEDSTTETDYFWIDDMSIE